MCKKTSVSILSSSRDLAHRLTKVFVVVIALSVVGPASNVFASITIGAGSSFSIPDGAVGAGCGDLTVADGGVLSIGAGEMVGIRDVTVQAAGLLQMAAGLLSLSGSWNVPGAFVPGTGTVQMSDGCGITSATITGDNEFCNLEQVSSMGKTIRFESGTIQTITCNYTAKGVIGTPIVLRSTLAGDQAHICLKAGATQEIDSVDVADNHAICQLLAPGNPEQFHSIDSGNTYHWFLFSKMPIPTLNQIGMALLLSLILIFGWIITIRRSRMA